MASLEDEPEDPGKTGVAVGPAATVAVGAKGVAVGEDELTCVLGTNGVLVGAGNGVLVGTGSGVRVGVAKTVGVRKGA